MNIRKSVIVGVLTLAMFLVTACGQSQTDPSAGAGDQPVPGGQTVPAVDESEANAETEESSMPAVQEDSEEESKPEKDASSETEASTDTAEESTAPCDSYVFTTETGIVIEMSAEAAPILEQLGDYVNYFEAVGCAGLGTQRYYIYSGFELGTYEEEDGDGTERIYSVVFSNDLTQTTEGVCIGDTLEWAMSIYPDCTGTEAVMTTEMGECRISFTLADGVITGIQYITLAV